MFNGAKNIIYYHEPLKMPSGKENRGGKQCFDTLLKDWLIWSWC